MNNNSKHIISFGSALLTISLLVSSCDTAKTIEDPTANYFTKYYGGDGNQEGVDVVVGSDGSMYLLGNTITNASTNGTQLYLVKTDVDGIVIWEKVFGGKFDDEAKDIELTTDNRLAILATSKKGADEKDILVMTFSLDGVKIDSTLVGLKTIANEEADDNANSISQTSDGFIVAGSTTSVVSKPIFGITPDDVTDAMHLRFTNNLALFTEASWTRTSGTIGADGASKVYQLSSGASYYVFGYSNVDVNAGSGIKDFNFWVYQLGATAIPSNNQMYPGALVTDEILTDVVIPSAQSGDGFLLVGSSSDASGNLDIYVSKLRKTLTFNPSVDYQLSKPLSAPLGKPDASKRMVSAFSSISGYLLLTNEESLTSNNFYLTKIDINGMPAWSNPESVTFGGQKEDYIGTVLELPDGRIIMIGTMAIGDEGQEKMALIKVNKDGKFLN